ncbi:MAG: heavy-metal-associated domain-containing protein [Rhodobacterales bacterium]
MTKFSIPDMTCGHCKKTVEETIHRLDAKAGIEIDLEKHLAAVATSVDAQQLISALDHAGYPAQQI